MGLADRLAELKALERSSGNNCQNRQKSTSVSSVSSTTGPYPENSPPTEPCPACGNGGYYVADAQWYCGFCEPATVEPAVYRGVVGGRVPDGEHQHLQDFLQRAVKGLEVDVETLEQQLSRDDIDDITHGRMKIAAVRGFAALVDQGDGTISPP